MTRGCLQDLIRCEGIWSAAKGSSLRAVNELTADGPSEAEAECEHETFLADVCV